MRQVDWFDENALARGGRSARGTLAELLTGGPYPSLSPPEVPPLVVVNETLSNPGSGGMNGGRRWTPFTIGEAEYKELVHDLVSGHAFEQVDVPGWVSSRDDWHVWLMERRWGVPAKPHRRLRQQARELAGRLERAQRDPDVPRERQAQLFLAAKRAQDEADHFCDPWMTVPTYSKSRRTTRWLRDARLRAEAAELAGDEVAARSAAADIARLDERVALGVPDEQWPAEWEDWPEYPPPERRS